MQRAMPRTAMPPRSRLLVGSTSGFSSNGFAAGFSDAALGLGIRVHAERDFSMLAERHGCCRMPMAETVYQFGERFPVPRRHAMAHVSSVRLLSLGLFIVEDGRPVTRHASARTRARSHLGRHAHRHTQTRSLSLSLPLPLFRSFARSLGCPVYGAIAEHGGESLVGAEE